MGSSVNYFQAVAHRGHPMTHLACSLIPLSEDDVETYQSLADRMAEVWLDNGALAYRDYVGDDLDAAEQGGRSFSDLAGLDETETLLLATLAFESREHRDDVQAKVSQDERVGEIMADGPPFDAARMASGGFELLVEG